MAETEQVTVSFEEDGSSRAVAQGMVDALNEVFSRSIGKLGDRLEKPLLEMVKAMNRVNKEARSARETFDDIDEAIRRASRTANAFETTMKGIVSTSRNTGNILDPRVFDASAQSFNRLDDQADRLITTFQRLVASGKGTDRTLENLTAGLRSQANVASVTANQLGRLANTEAKARADAARVAQQRITAIEVAAGKERIVAAQQEGSRALAASRAAAQRRVEVFRAAVAQIRALERGLGTVFSTTASAIGKAFSGVGRTISSAMSRNNREMTQGLQSSLTTRQNIISRSFRSQEQTINSSVARQSASLDRLERELSTGVTGFATGRSAAANALGVGGGILAGAGLVKVLRDGLMAGADFTAGLAVLDAQLQLTDEQMASVRKTALNLGNDITLPGVSALDAAEAIQQLSKQFGALGTEAPAAATAAAKGVLQLSRATKSSSEDAAQVVGAAINVFKIQADQAGLVADQVANAMSKAAGTSFTDFSAAFKQGATVFAQFQVPALGAKDALLEFNTALATLAQGGLVGSDAGTSLRSFFLQANRGTDEANEALAELSTRAGVAGTAFFEADGDARGLGDTLEILRAGLAGLTDQERTDRLFTIFGADAVRAAEILTNTTGPAFDAMREQLRRQGTAAELAAAQNQGLRGAMDALGSVVETQLILAYEKLQIAAGNVVLTFAKFTDSLASGEGVYAMIRTALKGIAVGLGGLLAIKVVAEGFGLLRVALAGLLSPLGLVILAFAGAGAAFAILMERSEEFRKVVDEVKSGFVAMVEAFKANDPDSTSSGFAGVMERIGVEARKAFNFIGDELIPRIADLGRTIGSFFTDVFTGSDQDDLFIRALTGSDSRTVGEKIGDFIRSLAGPVIDAFNTAFGFIRDAITGGSPDDIFMLALTGEDNRSAGAKFGARVREIFNTAATAIRGFAEDVSNFLAPAVSVLQDLGGALVDMAKANPAAFFTTLGAAVAGGLGGFAIGGPLGGLIGAAGGGLGALFAQGFGDEIVAGLQGIGSTILEGIQTGLRAAGGVLSRVFAVDNLIDFGLFATELAQRLGRVLGNVLSDPRLVAGAAGLAGFAALAAARFVIGFGQGVISNVPELARMFQSAFSAALEAAFDALTSLSAGTLLTGLAGLFIGRQALSAFRSAGQTAGAEVQKGMFASFRQASFGGAFAGGGSQTRTARGSFITSLFGGAQGIQNQSAQAALLARNSLSRELQRQLSTLQLAGRGQGLKLYDEAGIRSQFDQLSGDIGPSGILGLRVRNALSATWSSLRSGSLGPIRRAFTDMGITAGEALKSALAKGVAGAAGAIAGFQTGKALGGQSLLEGLLGVGGVALALGAVNPVMGVSAGLAGALGLALGKAGEGAKKAAAETAEYRDALIGLSDAEVTPAATSVFFENLKDESDEVASLLSDVGFDVEKFVDDIVTGTSTGGDHFNRIIASMGDEGRKFSSFLLSEGVDSAREFERAIKTTSAGRDFRRYLESIGTDADAVIDTFDLLTDESNELHDGLKRVADENALRGLTTDADAAKAALGGMVGGLQALSLVRGLEAWRDIELSKEAAEEAQIALENAKVAANDFLNGDYGDTLTGAIDDLIISLPGIQSQLEGLGELPAAVAEATKRQLGDRISVDLRAAVAVGLETGEITNATVYLNDLKAQVQAQIDGGLIPVQAGTEVIAQIDKLLTSPTFGADIANLMRSIVDSTDPEPIEARFTISPTVVPSPDAAQKIRDATEGLFAGGGGPQVAGFRGGQAPMARGGGGGGVREIDVPVAINPVITVAKDYGANLSEALGRLRNTGAKPGVIDVPMEINPILTVSPAFGLNLAIALARLRSAGGTPGVINVPLTINPILTVAPGASIGAALAGLNLAQTVARGVAAGTGTVASAAQAMARAAIAAALTAVAPAGAAGVAFATRFVAGIRGGIGAAAAAARALSAAAAANVRVNTGAAFSAGVALGSGLASGIRAGTGQAVAAARSMAAQVAAASRSALKIASPSRVFRDIGNQIGAGLAQGIADSEGEISGVLDDVLGRVTDRAVSRAELVAKASANIFDLLRPQGQNGQTSTDGILNRANLARIVPDLQNVFDEAAKTLWESAVAFNEGTANATQRAIAIQNGQGFNQRSLDPGAILGGQNVEGVVGVLDRIRDFISDSVAAGTNVDSVVAQARQYLEQVRAVGRQYGVNATELEGLLAASGLSSAALERFRQEVAALQKQAAKNPAPTVDPEAAREAQKKAEEEQAERDREAKEREEENQRLMLELLRIAVAKPTSIELAVPYGDPEAIALATLNRIADSLSV